VGFGQRSRSGSPGWQHPDLSGTGAMKAHRSLKEWDKWARRRERIESSLRN
jgi:hypothetical protein